MITKKDLETLSETRLDDAVQLFQTARYSAAYYLSGYAIELGIKACIAGLHMGARQQNTSPPNIDFPTYP